MLYIVYGFAIVYRTNCTFKTCQISNPFDQTHFRTKWCHVIWSDTEISSSSLGICCQEKVEKLEDFTFMASKFYFTSDIRFREWLFVMLVKNSSQFLTRASSERSSPLFARNEYLCPFEAITENFFGRCKDDIRLHWVSILLFRIIIDQEKTFKIEYYASILLL